MPTGYDDDLWEVPAVQPSEEYEQAVTGGTWQDAAGADAGDAAQLDEDFAVAVGEAMPGTSGAVGFQADELDCKLLEHFGGKIVRKDLTALMKRGANVPTFVLEYLLGM